MAPLGREMEVTTIHPADSVMHVAEAGELECYDGVVWTGSSLTIHEQVPEVQRQIELARRCFEVAVPQYGSCWGLQISAAAAGIPCEPNPKGREHGIARQISLTPEGLAHPMFDGTMKTFDGICAHTDHVAASWASMDFKLRRQSLPPNTEAQILASNAFSPVQALSVKVGAGEFWSVQYHPELTLGDVAKLMLLPAPVKLLIEQGRFKSEEELRRYSDLLMRVYENPEDSEELRKELRIGDDVLDAERRSRELSNWLHHCVLPTSSRDLIHMRGPRVESRAPKSGGTAKATLHGTVYSSTVNSIEVDNPYSGQVAASVQILDTADVVAQVVRAKNVQRVWAEETTIPERVAMCARFLDALEADGETIAREISMQMGKPLAAARGEVKGVRERAEAMMSLAPAALGNEDLPEKANFIRRIEKVPVGVVLCIAPWNYPLLTAINW